MNRSIPRVGWVLSTALFLVGAAHGAVAQDHKPVHYTCADGTKLQAIFSPPSTSMGSVKLVYAGSSTETTLPQALSADGGRYMQGDVEFWIKGEGATLTRAGKSTTCRTSS
jgi:membrane-bound inhibitor of C-type lysozyme